MPQLSGWIVKCKTETLTIFESPEARAISRRYRQFCYDMRYVMLYLSFFLYSTLGLGQTKNIVKLDRLDMYYEEQGTGKPLVLLHGYMWTHAAWDDWVEDLSKNHRLIIPDLRGHGESTNPDNNFTHKRAAEDIIELLDYLVVDTFSVIGISSGGNIALHLSIMEPTRLQSAILIGATTHYPQAIIEEQKSTSADETYEGMNKEMKSFFLGMHPRGEKQVKSLISNFKQLVLSGEDMVFTKSDLSAIESPTLIIHGDKDHLFPVNIPVETFNAIPNSYLWIVPNHGHEGINKNSKWAGSFLSLINDFLLGNWTK